MRGFIILFFFFSFFQSQSQINLLYNWQDTTLVGSTWYDNAYNEVWGLEVNDYEIAIIGSTLGTHFIDVTNSGYI